MEYDSLIDEDPEVKDRVARSKAEGKVEGELEGLQKNEDTAHWLLENFAA